MSKKNHYLPMMLLSGILIFLLNHAVAQNYRPGLLFREDWKEIPAEIPLNQRHVANPDLTVHRYGAGADSIKKSNHERPVDDPFYVWSGLCIDNWAVTLRHEDAYADLTGFAKVKWRSKQEGLRQLRLLIKLSDGTWLVSDACDGPSRDWRIREFNIQDINWYGLDIDRITPLRPVTDPDLSKVDEIGFTDLMTGGGSRACSRLDWIEVYASPVSR